MQAATRPRPEETTPVFVARQPVYTRGRRIYGYELLFRNSAVNEYPQVEPSQATARLLTSSVVSTGLERLSDGRPLMVNFPRELLVGEYFRLLPRGRVVIEVLEDVPPDAEVIRALEIARAERHVVALDDVASFRPDYVAMYELADIIKVDFRATTPAERVTLTAQLREYAPTLLAEKLETEDEVAEARALGYTLLQGYALSRPRIMRTRGLEAMNVNALELLRLASEPHVNFRDVESVISRDVSLTYRMMRLVNSVANGLSQRVTAIRHALTMLGQTELLRAASLLVLASASGDRPGEIAVSSLTRARCMEALARERWPRMEASAFYLTGIFSRLDELLDVPMEEALGRLPVGEAIEAALLGGEGPQRALLDLVAHYERAEWEAAERLAATLGIEPAALAREYPGAVEQADGMLSAI